MKTLVLLAGLALPCAAQAGVTAEDILVEAKADCASFDNGTVTMTADAVTPVDLTGDGQPESIVDWSKFTCSTMASAWGGTGGSMVSVLIGETRSDYMALGWKVVDFGGPVLLLQVHGAECGGTGSDPCVDAEVWNGQTMMSVRAVGGDEDSQPVEGEGADPAKDAAAP
jgi:hypothetical protein